MNDPYDLMKQMNTIKNQMESLKAEMKNLVATGTAGAGMVNVSINGEYSVTRIEISDELFSMNDKGMIEVLTASAFNDATVKLRELMEEKSRSLMAQSMGMNI